MGVHHLASFTYVKAVAPHDTTDNLTGALFIQNIGSAGTFVIRQDGGYGNVTVGLAQYDSMAVGQHWKGVMSTSLGAGVVLVAFR